MRFHCGFSFNWKTIKKWLIPILIGTIILFCQNLTVLAYTEQGYIESGDSVKDYFNIGNYGIGTDYYIFIDTNANNQSSLNGYFYMYGNFDTTKDSTTLHFALDHCKTGTNSYLTLYSYYYNYVDYSYNLGTSVYLTNQDYANANCYRSFIRLRVKYTQIDPINEPNLFMIQNYNNNFTTYNNNSYGILLRYNDLIYLNDTDYNLLLESVKNGSSNIDIKNSLNSIHNDLGNVKNSVDDVKDSVDDVKDAITDSSLANGTSGSAYFGDNVWQKNYGISSLITIPIDLVNSISTKTCSPLVIDLPFMNNKSITLPCLSNLIETNFKQLFDLYQVIIGGFICYNCALHIYKDIENALDPESNTSVAGFFV